ncbi:MAG: hypothetical protein ABSF52_22010 [Syntrophobacteraceae bacterium]|jgi:hypothetical protein
MDLPRLKIGISPNYLPVYCRDRYTHILLVGKSGTGKSSLLSRWWDQDDMYGNARILVEPSGFLAKDCYSISRGKALYCSLDLPTSLNPMAQPYDPNQIVDNICESINQVIEMTSSNQSLTVKMRAILDDAIKYCLSKNRKTLVNVRDHIEGLAGDDATREGILARLDHLLGDERLTEILCGHNPVEWGKFIQKRHALIFDGFGMGKEKMIFCGTLIAQGLKNYFRYERPTEYRPVSLYIDECHNFVNPNLFDILKEGRKFKLASILSTQDFALIGEKLTRVMLNVGTVIAYRLGSREAALLAREIRCRPEEIQDLENFHVMYATPREQGMAKTPRPPFVKPIEPKKAKLQKKTEWMGWFPLKANVAREKDQDDSIAGSSSRK